MPPKKKEYEVVGTAPVFGHPPGAKFEAAIDETHEQMLVDAGSIKVVGKKKD